MTIPSPFHPSLPPSPFPDPSPFPPARTVLHPCHTLHTLAIFNSECGCLPGDPCTFKIVRRIVEAAHNIKVSVHVCVYVCVYMCVCIYVLFNYICLPSPPLQTLGLSCTTEMKNQLSGLSSDSLRSLHLQFTTQPDTSSDLFSFLQPLLPNFPKLHTLSLDEKYVQFPLEALAPLLRTRIDVTKWVPEFLSPLKWDFPSEYTNIFNF